MNRSLLLVLAAAAAGLAACQTEGPPGPPPAPVNEAFSDQDFGWSTQPGPDSVDGVMAFHGGPSQYTCQEAVLIPMTPWSRRRMIILYGSDDQAVVSTEQVRARTPSAPSGAYSQYVRHAACDAGDHFSFTGLPDGAWYVITVATPLAGGDKTAIMRHVETRGGERHITLP